MLGGMLRGVQWGIQGGSAPDPLGLTSLCQLGLLAQSQVFHHPIKVRPLDVKLFGCPGLVAVIGRKRSPDERAPELGRAVAQGLA